MANLMKGNKNSISHKVTCHRLISHKIKIIAPTNTIEWFVCLLKYTWNNYFN